MKVLKGFNFGRWYYRGDIVSLVWEPCKLTRFYVITEYPPAVESLRENPPHLYVLPINEPKARRYTRSYILHPLYQAYHPVLRLGNKSSLLSHIPHPPPSTLIPGTITLFDTEKLNIWTVKFRLIDVFDWLFSRSNDLINIQSSINQLIGKTTSQNRLLID